MSQIGSAEENRVRNSSKNTEGEVAEVHTVTQEAVNEIIKKFISPLTKQLENWLG